MTRRLPWVLAAAGVLLVLAGIGLSIAAGSSQGLVDAQRVASTAVFGVLGALIATRHPHNPIGWIFCAVAAFTGVGILAFGYTELWLEKGTGPDRLGETAAVYHNASWIPNVLLPTTFLLLLFPDGRLIGPRWRLIGWCAAVGMVGGFAEIMLHPGRVEDFPQVHNPYGSDAADPLGLAYVVLAVGVVGSAVSLVIRFRRADGEQRHQIKWLALAGGVAAATLIVVVPLYDVVGEEFANVAILLTVMLVPVAAGVAILRYHLYDIDVVINRTLVYAALTATLAGAYLASVLLLQLALSPLTEESDLAIAASTLAVAALFRPARSRIQAVVDRRFFRSKYHAQRTLESFSARLRDEVALDTLAADLRGVVVETVQPAHVSLWLRETIR